MGPLAVLAIAGVGLLVGLLAGLIGIGGGVLIVPFLYFFYDHPDLFGVAVSPDARVVLAHGTSLFVILPTSALGAFSFHRRGLVEWRAALPIGLASVVAAGLGASLALALPPPVLRSAFGALLVVSGTQMALRRPGRTPDGPPPEPRLDLWATMFVGAAVGLFSALLGVGGGVVAIPLLLYLIRLDVRRVAATSIGVVAITAVAGTLSYMIAGMQAPGLPSWTVGYVHVSAGVFMFVGSLLSVRWGAALNQKLPPRTLTVIFAVFFVLLGAALIVENVGALAG